MRTEHTIGFVIIGLLLIDVYLAYQQLQLLQQMRGGQA